MIKANDPKLKSWVEVPANSDFSIQNIPFGIFKTDSLGPRAATAIGTQVLDLMVLEQNGYFEGLDLPENIFAQPTLNAFMELGKAKTRAVRNKISDLLEEGNTELKNNAEVLKEAFFEQSEVEMCMPIQVPNYTDFYSSEQHAFNVGTMFRGPENALMPNWKHIPVGYHGRASSIVVSGTDFHRPKGQTKADDADMPSFGPCRLLDFELEMGFITCKENPLGQPVSTAEADEYIFGFVLLNDWSARDIQKWEYVPLGPFLAKNFASHVSPWIVTMDALEPFTVTGPVQDPEVLPYLKYEGDKHFDVKLQVGIQPEGVEETVVSNSNFKYMYWNVKQQLAHHTVNGCNMQVGDLYGSGTISGPTKPEFGSMLEITWRGSEPVKMADGTERKFIQDGDTVIMRGHAEKDGVRVGFGEVTAKVLPAK
ncbi:MULTISPECIES: fumarylacetoacetase [Roseivirga]|uniref:fumarylacetoacetase n=1 Tax=Roseivirga spongicola TaxID=333140 RepID=A0A150XAE2_9BACT|nr:MULTISPECIES: fumarylacetoacetase [Roseivirga]KYG75644.1 fumarylacetoacetase [Roseivirga spongicola]MBO6662407.1 fumarylacetoacetase [Roseivirga sp.]MBO6761903.1 fumarylacetoacetase [Roseivirga sp.]MBO6910029.1 fumarylacetoacetase [Roseivirga sp.]WPZ10794.1 fumarylacetoacetase [Roseivirga spongicola]